MRNNVSSPSVRVQRLTPLLFCVEMTHPFFSRPVTTRFAGNTASQGQNPRACVGFVSSGQTPGGGSWRGEEPSACQDFRDSSDAFGSVVSGGVPIAFWSLWAMGSSASRSPGTGAPIVVERPEPKSIFWKCLRGLTLCRLFEDEVSDLVVDVLLESRSAACFSFSRYARQIAWSFPPRSPRQSDDDLLDCSPSAGADKSVKVGKYGTSRETNETC